MKPKKDYINFFICITLISIFLILTYLNSTAYVPFVSVSEIQYMLASTSCVNIEINDITTRFEITDSDTKIKLYNVLSKLKLRNDILSLGTKLNKKHYFLILKYLECDGSEKVINICIFENGMIKINNKLFEASENIYSIIDQIYKKPNGGIC
ncbi:MAG: hypothetical protein RR144_05895 [Clostridia bacterium]